MAGQARNKEYVTMKKSKKLTVLAAALAVAVLCGGAALATVGGESDPLITLSYLEETFFPAVVDQVDDRAKDRQEEMEDKFSAQVKDYKTEMKDLLNTGATGEATYVLVTLAEGQSMALDVGCELMLRVGSATVSCGTNPALIDISTGGTLNKGASLEKNHLYMATIPDRVLTPTAATVKVLVRGGYTVI